jgi:hypothetical protein
MKNAWRQPAAVMFVSVIAVSGCSSTQPDSIETRSSSLGFEAKALVDIEDCYEEWQDLDADGTPDLKISDSLRCFPALDPNGVPMRADRAVPWRYSILITVVRAGTTNEDLVTSLEETIGGLTEFPSLTDYDPDEISAPLRANEGDLYYLSGLRLSTGSPIYLTNIGVDPGVPNILNVTPTFDFNLNTGDTVIVRARKQLLAQAPLGSPTYENLKISAVFAVSGVQVAPQATPPGFPPTSSTDDASGITFSFTVR